MTGSLDTTSSPGEEKGWMPLMCAAEAGDIDTLTALLTDGCDIDIDIDARDYDGSTALALAAQNGHAVVVERLLEYNANPNLSDLDQVTPLWKAARYGHTSVVQLLLASTKLSDINPRPSYLHEHRLEIPLSISIKEGHRKTAEVLSRADGIDPCLTTHLRYREKVSVLSLALRDGFEDVALSLLDKCDTGHESQDADDNAIKDTIEPASKLLVFAVAAGCSKVVRELVTKHSADVNVVHRYYAGKAQRRVEDNPLMAASRRGDLNAVRLLLDMDEIRPGMSSNRSGTALTVAAQGGFVEVVKILIADGRIEVDHQGHDGRTALSFAAESGSKDTVNELLATRAANPNGRDSRGRTPLIWAADPGDGYGPDGWQSYQGVICRLLSEGEIDVNTIDFFGRTALLYAAKNGALGLVIALLEHPQIDPTLGPKNTSPLVEAAFYGHADVVQALISIGHVNVNAVLAGINERTALMTAVEYGRVECESATQVLLSTADIDVNFQDSVGKTALMLAASGGTAGMVKLILNARCNPNLQDRDGNTAITTVCRAWDFERLKVLLGDPGVEPDLPDNLGRTALSIAAEAGNIEYVNTLLAREDVKPDSRDILGRSPLSWAFGEKGLLGSGEERKAVLRQLLNIPAVDPNAEDHSGLTPLLRAIMSSCSHEYVEVLLSRPDLDVNRPPVHGRQSPLDTAKLIGNMETIALLRARGASDSVNPTILQCCDENPAIEIGVLPGFMFEETRPRRRQLQHSYRSSAQGSETSSDESDFDSHGNLTVGRMGDIVERQLKEYHLRLGEQQTYVDEWAESMESLCSSCLDIDLGSAFWRRHTEYEGHAIADLGRIDETWRKKTCSLCRLFANVYPRTSPDEGHRLVSFSTTQSWLCHSRMVRWNDFQSKRFFDTMLLAVVADKGDLAHDCVRGNVSPSRGDKDTVETAFSSGLIGRLGRNGPNLCSLNIPRMTTEIKDWSIARGWITLCRKNHSGECNPRRAATVPHFFLIDGCTRQIVEQKESQTGGPPPYVALSYVWGQSQGSRQLLQRQKQQKSLDGKVDGIVEPAIEDAIRVTLELGYRYLWVDRYCIVQTGDEAIKQEQLRHMHLVYANAEVTLIAAAGKDSSAGLPGVPGRPRNQQPGALIDGHALVCIPPDPSFHIRSRSTLATRGWTYQEGLLARRRLYFSEYEMSYECRHILCRESIRLPVGLEQRISGHKPRHMEPFWMYQPYKFPGMDSSQTGIGIFDLLGAYTKRKLSLPSDTLNAMLGIFNLLSQHKKRPIYHICGVAILRLPDQRDPESRETSREPWGSSSSDGSDNAASVRLLGGWTSSLCRRQKGLAGPSHNADTDDAAASGLGGFLDGLCCRLNDPAHRRPGFPSWSWTGWQGVVAGMNKDSTAIKQTNGFAIDVSIIPCNQDGGVAVPWSRCYDQLRMADDSDPDIRSGQNHMLQITASAVTIRFRKGEYDGQLNTWIGTVCAGHGVWQGEFFLTSKDVPVSSLLQDS